MSMLRSVPHDFLAKLLCSGCGPDLLYRACAVLSAVAMAAVQDYALVIKLPRALPEASALKSSALPGTRGCSRWIALPDSPFWERLTLKKTAR